MYVSAKLIYRDWLHNDPFEKQISVISQPNKRKDLFIIAIDEWSNQLDAFKLIDLMDMLNPTWEEGG